MIIERIKKSYHQNDLNKTYLASTDAKIDRMVYELYGLTEDEVRVVEGK